MKIKELKEILNSLPPEMDNIDVFSTMASGCCGDYEELDGLEVDSYLPVGNSKGMLRLSFSSLDGYRSCRQSAQTKQDHKDYWAQFPSSSYSQSNKDEKKDK